MIRLKQSDTLNVSLGVAVEISDQLYEVVDEPVIDLVCGIKFAVRNVIYNEINDSIWVKTKL
jgi:hypothetical protein